MIDPQLWGNMPGLGRAPLQAAPVSPSVSSPMQDIARRLIMATGNDRTRVGEMPVGSLTRPVESMTSPQLLQETAALGGGYAGRAPAVVAGALSGIPFLGTAMSQMAKEGMSNRQVENLGEFMNRMPLQTMDRPTTQTRSDADRVADPYMAGRAAARQMRESRSDTDQRSRDTGGRSVGSSEIGAGGWAGRGL